MKIDPISMLITISIAIDSKCVMSCLRSLQSVCLLPCLSSSTKAGREVSTGKVSASSLPRAKFGSD